MGKFYEFLQVFGIPKVTLLLFHIVFYYSCCFYLCQTGKSLGTISILFYLKKHKR